MISMFRIIAFLAVFGRFVQGNIFLTDGNCGSTYGKCAAGYCCSRYGYCGTSTIYCGHGCQSLYGNCLSVPTLTPTIASNLNGRCGAGIGSCSSGYCCSSSGYCGISGAYCGSGCQSGYGSCSAVPSLKPTFFIQPVAVDGRCGQGFGFCPLSYCCSSYRYCGVTPAYCGSGCQNAYGNCSSPVILLPTPQPSKAPGTIPNSNGACGSGIGSCPSGYCCSAYGYCGLADAYCGSGCQANFGVCTATTAPLLSPTVTPTIFPSIFPTNMNPGSVQPSVAPTINPTKAPTSMPTLSPSNTLVPSSSKVLSSIASWTYYDAYPKCCPNEPNYDPNYPTTECDQYNGCAHPGDFAAIGQRSLSYVQSNDLIAFYDNSDPNGNNFYSMYGNKYISISGECNGVRASFTSLIADTCGNNDCGGCCATNADPNTGYLIDMEYYTVIRHFGTTDCADAHHNLQFSIDLNQPPAIPNCGSTYGPCNGPQQCCSSSDYCGSTSAYCSAGCQSAYGYFADVVGGCGPVSGQVCSSGLCCSQYGYCGSGSAYCGSGCQTGYGSCQ